MITLSFKVTADEAKNIRSGARRERVTVSEYLRRQAAAQIAHAKKPEVRICPLTGAPIFASTPGLAPLTVASTREFLADFP